jgi:uncharacterized membrane protein (UPF0127 family)
LSLDPIAAATPPVMQSPRNIHMKTRWRNPDSARATSAGWAAYSTGGGAYFTAPPHQQGMDATPTEARRFRGLPRTTLLGFSVRVATTRRARLLGLALLRRERAGEGLLIPGCRSVHTFGMRVPLDLIFLDRDERIVRIARGIPPRRIIRCSGAHSVLELPSS